MNKTITESDLASLVDVSTRRLRKLAEQGHIPHATRGRYPTGETLKSLFAFYRIRHDGRAELTAALIRDKTASAKLRELEHATKSRELVTMTEAEDVVRSYLMPVRDLILSAPSALAPRVNPSDPELARLQLEEWVEDGLKHVREVGASEEKAQNAAA